MANSIIEDKELMEAVKLFMESLGHLAAYVGINGTIEYVKGITLMTEELIEIREENKCKKLH